MTDADSSLVIRRLMIDLSEGFARHWNGNDAFRTAYMNALSMSFPVGEQFFIDAVKNGAKFLPETPENESLHRDIKGFIGQEATHRRLHVLYNTHLERQGLVNNWGPRSQRRMEQGRRDIFEKNASGHLHELAITAAYEHYTSIFGDMTLAKSGRPGDWFEGAQEPLKTLWYWHAAEESEHKCVAFDLYQKLGGNYAWRMRWFWYVSIQFSLDLFRQTINNLWHDKTLFKLSTWWSVCRFILGPKGLLWQASKPLVKYIKKDFHPNQLGDPAQAKDWLQKNSNLWTPVGAKN